MQGANAKSRDYILLYVNGVRHEVRGQRAFQTLADFLRRDLQVVGTKIMCAEGDCGACAVLVGKPSPSEPSKLAYASVDSCIFFLWQADRCHVVTVEGLAGESQLHPVQQAIVDCHGSQCGFCTPGFVVQLAELLTGRQTPPSVDEVRLSLSGNLCRCTGYQPLLEAARSAKFPVPDLNEKYRPEGMISDFTAAAGKSIDISAEPALVLKQDVPPVPRHLYAPATVEDAVRFKATHPAATIIAGATEIGVRTNKFQQDPAVILSLANLPAITESVTVKSGVMHIGPRATWALIERACEEHLPEFTKIIRVFGGPAIRNVATLAGNIANASPIADSIPLLMVLEGSLELTSPANVREVPINSFYRGYKQIDLAANELITSIRIPLPAMEDLLRLYKVSKRRDLDISTFGAAVWMQVSDGRITACRIAYAGVAQTVLRLSKTEAALIGQPVREETFTKAGKVARAEVSPISDVRGSADFRLQLCQNILTKFYYEVFPSSSLVSETVEP
jgi:xanthine dehydrogenase small subunit